MFVSLKRLEDDLDLEGRVNTAAGVQWRGFHRRATVRRDAQALVRRRTSLDDLGLTLRPLESRGVLALESAAGVLDEARVNAADLAATQSGTTAQPVFTYLANSLRSGSREIPYSLVAATDLGSIAGAAAVAGAPAAPPPIVITTGQHAIWA